MKKTSLKFLVVFSTVLLIFSTLIVGVSAFKRSEDTEKSIAYVRISDQTDLSELNRLDLEILQRYDSFVLIEAEEKILDGIEMSAMDLDRLPNRTEVTVKGNTFDIEEGPDLDHDITVEEYEEGTEGLYVVHMLGPVHPEWRRTLVEMGVDIINYVPNYAYEVSMTPREAEEVRSLDFVDWVGIYQPAYKLNSSIEEFIHSDSPDLERFLESESSTEDQIDPEEVLGGVNINIIPRNDASSIGKIRGEILSDQHEIVRSVENEDGSYRLTVSIDSMMEKQRTELKTLFQRLAQIENVYYISPYIEPQLHGEIDSQIIGGGAWFMDDHSDPIEGDWREGDPNDPYRRFQDYGAYINQIGYTGDGVTIAVADTGIGDGTVGDAGHSDLTGRVVGGHGFGEDSDYWADGHGHGTHCTGSAAADGFHGTGETFEEAEYYMAQGLAYESELFGAKIFSDGGSFVADDYYSIVEEPAQQSHSYIHSNSWGSGTRGAYSDSDEVFDQTVREANRDSDKNRPMVITVSAGNDGARGDMTTGSPGNAKNVITIGATQTYNPPDGYENAEEVAGFSSRGWTEDNRIKPDVTAPGEGIYSLTPPNVEEDGYQTMSGTSMSNPAVAGAASVVVEWYRDNYGERPSPAMVKSILINTANDLNDNISSARSPIPNQDEGWGIVDLSKLQYPREDPTPFTFQDQETLLETGDEQEYVIAPNDDDKALNITLAWTDEHAMEGDSEEGTPVLRNDLDLEVIGPDGDVYRGNAFNETAGSQSDTGYSFPGTDAMSIFDYNDNGWDDVNTVENVFIPPEKVEEGAYTVRVIGRNIPEDANNDGDPNQDFALTAHNTRRPSDGVVYTDSKRYAEEDTVEIIAVDWEFQGQSSYSEVGISSDSDPTGFNVTLTGDVESQELTTEIDISKDPTSEDVLEVSHDDYILVEYWDEDVGDGTGEMKTYEAYVDGVDPESPHRFNVDWWSPHGVPVWEDDATDDSGYTTDTSHENASTWDIRDHDSVVDTTSWDWGDEWFNKEPDEGMKSWLITPEIEIPEEDPRQMGIEFTFEHWRDFGDPLLYDGGNLKMSTEGPGGPFEMIEPEEGYDGVILDTHDNPLGGEPGWGDEVGWETATFELSDYAGETVHFRWEAGTEGWHDEDDDHLQGEGWRIDDLVLTEIVQGTDHNRLSWSASPNDQDVAWDNITGHLDQYNIYRSEDKEGPWDETTLLDNVRADRSEDYEYIDYFAGEADDTRWWYVIRAEKDVGNEENNEIKVPEPGGPSLSIDSPVEDEIFTTDEVTVEWTGDPDIDSYEVRLNEEDPIEVGDDTEHTFSGLSEGTHQVSITGFTADETAFDDVEFMVDMTSPELDIISPEDGAYVNESEVMIEWTGFDDISGIDYYEVRVDGGSWTEVGEDSYFVMTEGDHDETYEIEVKAHDRAGHTTTKTISFTIDLLDPVLEINFPEEGGWAGEDVIVEWYGLDDVSGMDHYSIRIPEDSRYEHWIDVGTDTEHEFLDLEGGEQYTVEIVALDNAGNYNMSSARFSVDPDPPHLDILYPERRNETDEYHIIGKEDVEVVWSRADQYSGLSHIDVQLNDEEWKEDIGVPSSYTFSDLSDGIHTVTVRVTNNARLETMESITFMVDTSPPTLEITSPDEKETYTTDSVTVEWEASDDYSGIRGYEIRLNQRSWIDIDLNDQHTFDDMDAREHFVEVRASNNAGYSVTESVTFIVDTEDPEINILSPEPDEEELFARDEVTVKWEGRDDVSGIDYYEVRINEGIWTNVGSSSLYTFKNLEDGEHVVEVLGYDVAGNHETVSTTFTVDTTAPELDLLSPEHGDIYDEDTVRVHWNGSDETSGIASYELRLEQGEWIEVDGTEYEFEGLDDGEYRVKVRAIDEAGHTSIEEASFTVDTTSPVLSIDSPESGEIFDKDTITVRWSGSDETSGISYYQVKMGDEDWMNVSKETKYEFTSVEDGVPVVTVRARDNAGNTQEDSVNFQVDTALDELSIDSPEVGEEFQAGIFSSSRPVTIEWHGESDPTDIVDYKIRINGGPWIDLDSNVTEYTFDDISEGEHKVEIRAEDEAGNVMIEEVTFEVSPGFVAAYWWLIVLIAAIIIGAVGFVLKKRKEGEEETTGSEEDFETEDFDEEEILYEESKEERRPPLSQEQSKQVPEKDDSEGRDKSPPPPPGL